MQEEQFYAGLENDPQNLNPQNATTPVQALPKMPPKDASRVFSRIGLAMFVFIAVQQIAVSVLFGFVQQFAPHLQNTGWFTWVISYVPLYFVAFPVFLAIIAKMPTYNLSAPFLRRFSPLAFLRLLLASIAIFYIFNLITVLSSFLIEKVRGKGISGPADAIINSNPWVNLFFVCIVAPFMEEFIFRQLLYKRVAFFGGKVAVFVTGLLFGLLHPNLYQLIYATLLGFVFGGIRYFTGKLWPCILLHMSANFMGSGAALLIYNYFGETATVYWGILLILATVIGTFIIARWFYKSKKTFVLQGGIYATPGKKVIFLNVGMMLYMLTVLALIVFSLFA